MSALSGLPPKLRADVAEVERRRTEAVRRHIAERDRRERVGDALRSGAAIAVVTVLLVLLWLAAGGCASTPAWGPA